MAACTSCAAPSIERVRLNCSVIWLVPSLLVLSMEASPVIWPNWRSRLAVTRVAVTSGLAPGKLGGDLDGGEVHLRQRRDGQRAVAEQPGEQHGHGEQGGCDRAGDEGGGDVHRRLRSPPLEGGVPVARC